jgi:hypothetical protein
VRGVAAGCPLELGIGDAKLLSQSPEYVERTATQILNGIGANESSVPHD